MRCHATGSTIWTLAWTSTISREGKYSHFGQRDMVCGTSISLDPSVCCCRGKVLYLVFKMVERLSGNRRVSNVGENLMALASAACSFEDGILKPSQVYGMATAAN